MIAEEAKKLADDLVDSWTYGTDLEDQLPEWVLRDLREKAALVFVGLTRNETLQKRQ